MKRERPSLIVGEVGDPFLGPVRMPFLQLGCIGEGDALGRQDLVGPEDVLNPEVEHVGLFPSPGLAQNEADATHVEEGCAGNGQQFREAKTVAKEPSGPIKSLDRAQDMVV